MINYSTLITSSEITGPGGLFDINATLPLIAIQFIVLMIILNFILFDPVLLTLKEREKYIFINLAKASTLLITAEEYISKYEKEIEDIQKQIQSESTNSQKFYKEIFESELSSSQKKIDNLVNGILIELENSKNFLDNYDREYIVFSVMKIIRQYVFKI